jgi:hypothetical protein
VQIEKLGEFSSQRQLQLQIQQFWFGVSNLLILQADALLDKEHIPLAKFWVDKIHTELTPAAQTSSSIMGSGSFMNKKKKNVVLIIHTHRDVVQSWSGFTFLSGWQQLTLDQLQREETDLRYKSIAYQEMLGLICLKCFFFPKVNPKSARRSMFSQDLFTIKCETKPK